MWSRAASQQAVKKVSTFRCCLRAVCATVIKFSANVFPRSLWVPNERLRQRTKARISRSAWL
jgi:hypothetical protein